jgi:hypothetical protein
MKRLFILLLCSNIALADSTNSGANDIQQTNTSGTNTSISGGYSQETSTTYQSGSSSNTTSTTNNSTSNAASRQPVGSAASPSMSVYSQSSCVIPLSLGVTTIGLGLSYGNYYIDEQCEARMDAALLNRLNMKVAALARLCQDPKIFYSMEQAGSICPAHWMIGAKAKLFWDTNPELRPDYDAWLKRKAIMDKKDETFNGKPIPSGMIDDDDEED